MPTSLGDIETWSDITVPLTGHHSPGKIPHGTWEAAVMEVVSMRPGPVKVVFMVVIVVVPFVVMVDVAQGLPSKTHCVLLL
jgi:hypothetical protein